MSRCIECKLAAVCVPLGRNGLANVLRICGVCGKPAIYLQVFYRKVPWTATGIRSGGWWRRVNPPCLEDMLAELKFSGYGPIWCDTCSGRTEPKQHGYDPLTRVEKR